MKNRVTKKEVNQLVNLIKQHGYWSEEVKQFNSQYTYDAMSRLNDKARMIYRYSEV